MADTPASWQRVESLFHAALALDPAARDAWLRDASGGDAALIAEVVALLSADQQAVAPGFISRMVAESGPDPTTAPPGWVGREVGPYRLVGELGRGGMGTVYLAERADHAYRARVAIKFVRGAVAGPELLRRLVAERQILADLAHPNIARLLDGGATDDGTPYLVMEHIDGVAIDAYCSARQLDLTGRLRLLLKVCAAVQHAHQALVVHRDIKPSNILVTPDGSPKLVDFGIAKLVEAPGGEDTATGLRLMTPAYASPEQIRAERVTVATDVYSLGCVLYLLISGRLPLDIRSDTPLAEIVRRVAEDEPPRPSQAATGAAARWRRALVGDLDAIALKALAKEPERRYASVEQLARDLAHYLQGEPVSARPASAGYRLRKFLRRHRAAVTASGLVVLALAAGLGASLWQRAQAEAARARAVEALELSNATRKFLLSLFSANAPSENRGREITARELLDRGMARVDSLGETPALQAELLYTLGRIQMQLANYPVSARLLERAVDRYRGLGRDTALVSAMTALGNAYTDLGWPDSAARAWQGAVDLGTARFGPESPEILAPLGNLGSAYGRLGDQKRAEATYLQAIALERKVLGAGDKDRVYAIGNLALLYTNTGRFREAEPLFREAVPLARAGFGNDHPVTAFIIDNYGTMLREAGRYDDAEPLLREGLATRTRVLGADHRFTAESYYSLGKMLAQRARPADLPEADSLLHLALKVYRARLGPGHPATAYVLHALGVLAYNRGEPGDAERWFRQALALRRGTSRRDGPAVTVQTLTALGHALRDQHSPGAAAVLREADSLGRARVDSTNPFRMRAQIGYALALADQGETARADSLFRSGLDALAARIGRRHPYVLRACARGDRAGLGAREVCS